MASISGAFLKQNTMFACGKVGRWGGRGWNFSQILAVWLVLVSYPHRHLVVGILVGIFGTVSFSGNPVLTNQGELCFCRIRWELRYMFGTVHFGGNPVLTNWRELCFWRIWRELRYVSHYPSWESDNLMKNSMGEARWELIYTDKRTDRRVDRCG